MSNTRFDSATHSYYIGDKRATGITTIIGVLAKPALIGWAAKMATEHAATLIKPGKSYTKDELAAFFEEAKGAHNKKKDAAATHGTDAHAMVEEWINLCLSQNGGSPIEVMMEKFESIRPFVVWAIEDVDRFLFSERQMFNEGKYIAGTADFGAVMKDGKKLIGDFKTSSGIFGIDYFLQCAGYKFLAEAEGDEPYDGCVIVRLGKKGPKDFDVTYRYDNVTDAEAFMACLTIYRAQATYKKP